MPFIKGARPAGETLTDATSEVIRIMDAKLERDGTLADLNDGSGGGPGRPGGSGGPDNDRGAAGHAPASTGQDGAVDAVQGAFDAGTCMDLNTLVINDDLSDFPDGEKPAFLRHYEEAAVAEKKSALAEVRASDKSDKSDSGSSTPTLLTQEVDLQDLRHRLELLASSDGKQEKATKKSPKKKS